MIPSLKIIQSNNNDTLSLKHFRIKQTQAQNVDGILGYFCSRCSTIDHRLIFPHLIIPLNWFSKVRKKHVTYNEVTCSLCITLPCKNTIFSDTSNNITYLCYYQQSQLGLGITSLNSFQKELFFTMKNLPVKINFKL